MEAIMIDQEDPEAKLNSKAKWGLNSIPRLVVHQDLPESHNNGQNGQVTGNADVTEQPSNVIRTPAKHKLTDIPPGVNSPSKKRKWSIVDHFGNSDHSGQGRVSDRIQAFNDLSERNSTSKVSNVKQKVPNRAI